MISATEITATIPATSSGRIAVTTSGGTATTASSFTVMPSVVLNPLFAAPTQSIGITAAGFSPDAAIAIAFDATALASATSNGQGVLNVTRPIPASATPGKHMVTLVQGSGGMSAKAAFTVNTDWIEDAFGAGGNAYNPFENVISASTVGTLQLAWGLPQEVYAYPTQPVEFDGVLFDGDYTGIVRAISSNGTLLWTASTGAVLTEITPIVAGGIVVFGSNGFGNAAGGNRLFAFKAGCGSGGATCKPLWKATLPANITASLTTYGGNVIVPAGDGQIYPVDPQTGAIGTPTFAVDKTHGGITTAVHFDADGGFYYGTPGSFQGKYANGGSFEVLSTAAGFTAASLSGTTPYYLDTSGVLRQGASGWSVDLASPGCAYNVAVAGTTVYAGTCGLIGAYAAKDGHTVWSDSTFGPVEGITVANGIVYACVGNAIFAYEASNGTPLWAPATGDCESAPVVVNGTLYAAMGEMQAYTLNGVVPGVAASGLRKR